MKLRTERVSENLLYSVGVSLKGGKNAADHSQYHVHMYILVCQKRIKYIIEV